MFTDTEAIVLLLKSLVEPALERGDDATADTILTACRAISEKTIMGNLPPTSILLDLCNFLCDQKIAFALIGGLAVNVHGQARGTEDVDVLVEKLPDPQVLSDPTAMRRFGFYRGKSATGTSLILDSRTAASYVELLVANTPLKQWALCSAASHDVLRVKLPVVSPAALVALKVHAMTENPKRVPKDLPDAVSVALRHTLDESEIGKHLTGPEKSVLAQVLGRV